MCLLSVEELVIKGAPPERKFEIQLQKAEVRKQQCIGIIGEGGTGKTPLLDCLALRRPPAKASTLKLFGHNIMDLWNDKDAATLTQLRREHISYIAQDARLLSFLTIDENIRLGLHNGGKSWDADCDRVLTDLGLREDGFLKRYPHEIDTSQRRAAIVARALIKKHDLLFVDEPTFGVWSTDRERIWKAIFVNSPGVILFAAGIEEYQRFLHERITRIGSETTRYWVLSEPLDRVHETLNARFNEVGAAGLPAGLPKREGSQ